MILLVTESILEVGGAVGKAELVGSRTDRGYVAASWLSRWLMQPKRDSWRMLETGTANLLFLWSQSPVNKVPKALQRLSRLIPPRDLQTRSVPGKRNETRQAPARQRLCQKPLSPLGQFSASATPLSESWQGRSNPPPPIFLPG